MHRDVRPRHHPSAQRPVDAKANHQPLLAIVGQQARSALGGEFQQEVDLANLFKDVAHEYVQMATVPEQVLHLVDCAMRIARDRRAVTCLILPNDLQELDAAEPPREHAMMHTGIGYTSSETATNELDLAAAASVLNAGKNVAILAGAGALGADPELVAVADRHGAGIAKALLGKMAVPDDLPNVTGSIGLLGTAPSWKMMEDCNTLLMVGSSFPYSEYLPKPGQACAVQISIEPGQLGLRYPMEINLVGDARLTLQALLPLLESKEDRRWRRRPRLVARAGVARDDRHHADQSAARVLGAVAQAARRRDLGRRLRHRGVVVRT